MFGPKKDTRAKRAFKRVWKYSLLTIVWLIAILLLWTIVSKFIDPYGTNYRFNLICFSLFIFFGFVYLFAYFKDYLDEINEKLDRIEQKLNEK